MLPFSVRGVVHGGFCPNWYSVWRRNLLGKIWRAMRTAAGDCARNVTPRGLRRRQEWMLPPANLWRINAYRGILNEISA